MNANICTTLHVKSIWGHYQLSISHLHVDAGSNNDVGGDSTDSHFSSICSTLWLSIIFLDIFPILWVGWRPKTWLSNLCLISNLFIIMFSLIQQNSIYPFQSYPEIMEKRVRFECWILAMTIVKNIRATPDWSKELWGMWAWYSQLSWWGVRIWDPQVRMRLNSRADPMNTCDLEIGPCTPTYRA